MSTRDYAYLQDQQNKEPPNFNTLDFVLERVVDFFMDPVSGSNAAGRKVEGIVNTHVDDVLLTGSALFKQHVIGMLSKDFQVGSEDKNDIMFYGQRVQWLDRNSNKKRIVVDQFHKV